MIEMKAMDLFVAGFGLLFLGLVLMFLSTDGFSETNILTWPMIFSFFLFLLGFLLLIGGIATPSKKVEEAKRRAELIDLKEQLYEEDESDYNDMPPAD